MDDKIHVVYLGARALLLSLVGGLWMLAPAVCVAQSASEGESSLARPAWKLVLDGERAEWPNTDPNAPTDSVQRIGKELVRTYRRDGYYYADLDSAIVDTSASRRTVRIYVDRGPQVRVGRIRIEGTEVVSEAEVRRMLDTQVGDPLDPTRLEADIQAILDRYEGKGHPLAQVRVAETAIKRAPPSRLQLTLHVTEGPSLWLKEIDVPDDARTSPGLVARLAQLEVGAPLLNYDPETIQTRLGRSPFFDSVGQPKMEVTPQGGAILHVPVEESAPGAFDLALGYLPPSGTGQGGQLVGTGHLLLEHVFGGGRRLDLALDRRPGQASLFDITLSDPYIFGLPLRLTGHFEGEQRDSTYGQRSYGAEVGYHIRSDVELTGQVRREVVRPGQAGIRLRGGRQQIPRSQALFYGVGLRYEGVDRAVNPRQGLRLHVEVEQGREDQSARRIAGAGDTIRVEKSVRQERLRGRAQVFLPLFDQQVIVAGANGVVIRSRQYDRSDLFRIGGAKSLRGYDEDQFIGNIAARGLLEYRLQLDRRSYAYVFGDLGFVKRPQLASLDASQDWHPGYGVGIQIQTGIGLITTTYALNPEAATPADGRIHFGLSVAL